MHFFPPKAAFCFALIAASLSGAPAQDIDCTGRGGGDSGLSCWVQYKTAGSSSIKCGFQEFYQSQWPRRQIYRHQTSTGTNRVNSFESGTSTNGIVSGDCITVNTNPEPYYSTNIVRSFAIHNEHYDLPTCNFSENWSGEIFEDYENEDCRDWSGEQECEL